MKKTITILAALAILTGCASAPAIPGADKLRSLPTESMAECPAPTPLQGQVDGNFYADEALLKLGEVTSLYMQCRKSQKALADWILDGREPAK